MCTKTGSLNRNLRLCLIRVRFLSSLILKPSKQDPLWGKAVLVLVFSCDAGSAVGDGCLETAVALAGNAEGALAGSLVGNTGGALAGSATASKLLSASRQ